MNALVIDDDPGNARVFSLMLTRAGYRVQMASDGQSALRLIAEQPMDVVVCDWMLPDIDGPTVIQWARGSAAASLTLLLVSGLDADGVEKQALAAGADAFLLKPVTFARLVQSVEQARARRHATHGVKCCQCV